MDEYKSILAPFFKSYVEFKRSLGYKIQSTHVFRNFDSYLCEQDYNSISLSETILSSWCKRRVNESEATRYQRINNIKNFAVYLNGFGYPSFVPRLPKGCARTFSPYIFTQEELDRFFTSCDHFQYKVHYQSLHQILPALFRLLYGCGLRIGEALSLKFNDVDLKTGCITIHETKNGEERRLPVSDSLKTVLKQYVAHYRSNASGGEYFFVKQNGERCSASTIYKKFRKILFHADISHRGKGKGPRLHDFRHTFSVCSLVQMAEKGLDLYYCLPLLSKYLGHKSLAATDSYVRLTAEMHPKLLDKINRICAFIFPDFSRGDVE
jgi:integrase